MENVVANSLTGMFDSMQQLFALGLTGVLLVLGGFFGVKGFLRLRGNTAFTSFQQAVVAPAKNIDRSPAPKQPKETAFDRRLDDMVETEDTYDMNKLLLDARELGAIKKSKFHTAPVLESDDLGVLALIEEVVAGFDSGYRVLVNTSLDTVVDLEGNRATATRLSMAGVALKFGVVDHFGQLVMAIEHLGGAPMNRHKNICRTVVIEVLRKAGVWYLEIPVAYSGKDARAQITTVLRSHEAAQKLEEHVA